VLTKRQDQAVEPRLTEALSDGDLIERSLADPACFAAIFDRHADEILRYAHARLGPDLAEDVVATPAGTDITALYDIHPAAMPPGSVLLIQGAAIGGQGPRAAAEVSELASFPAPAVLTGNSLPPSCSWRVIARFPFRLLPRGGVTK
jgi:hypothetical protein